MKWLAGLLDSVRPRFEKGGALGALKPVFDATDAFFFGPRTRTPGLPHVRDPLDVKRFMVMVIIALAPCTLASFYFFGLRMLLMIVVSYAVGGTVEVLFAVVRKEEINEGFLVTGLIFPLVLPPALPLWMVGVGVAFGVLVGKELFGGTGRNLFNPAIVGRCFIAIAYAKAFTQCWVEPGRGLLGRLSTLGVDAVGSATPLSAANQGTWAPLGDLVLGRITGCAGETSALAILAGGGLLLLTRVASWRIVAGILASFVVVSAALFAGQPDAAFRVAWHLCAGGLLFGAFFMATDPVTSPVTRGGKWAYGILIGVATVLIRNLTGFDEGIMFAILLGNIAAPLIDEVVIRLRLRRMRDEG
jgi:Na(+)-translocating NADH:ubiquinone oxidoreductase B subunit